MSSGTGVAEFEIRLQICFWRLVKRVSQNGEQESREKEQGDIWSSGNHWLRASRWAQPVSAPPRRPEDVWTKHMLVVAHCWDLLLVIAQLVKNPPATQETPVQFLGREDPLEKGKATHSTILELPCGSAGKESSYNAWDLGSIPGLGRSPGEGYPFQYSGLENSMDYTVHGVTKAQTWLSNFHFLFFPHSNSWPI